jgi:hypothetical protein
MHKLYRKSMPFRGNSGYLQCPPKLEYFRGDIMASVPPVFDIMSRSGPEDNLAAFRLPVPSDSGYTTAGPAWVVGKQPDQPVARGDMYYKDEGEFERFKGIATDAGPHGQVIEELAQRRNICAKERYLKTVSQQATMRGCCILSAVSLIDNIYLRPSHVQSCLQSVRAHQFQHCTPASVSELKCKIKLCVPHHDESLMCPRGDAVICCRARAVDLLCRPQYSAFVSCLRDNSSDRSKCVKQWTDFDVCTEDF